MGSEQILNLQIWIKNNWFLARKDGWSGRDPFSRAVGRFFSFPTRKGTLNHEWKNETADEFIPKNHV